MSHRTSLLPGWWLNSEVDTALFEWPDGIWEEILHPFWILPWIQDYVSLSSWKWCCSVMKHRTWTIRYSWEQFYPDNGSQGIRRHIMTTPPMLYRWAAKVQRRCSLCKKRWEIGLIFKGIRGSTSLAFVDGGGFELLALSNSPNHKLRVLVRSTRSVTRAPKLCDLRVGQDFTPVMTFPSFTIVVVV